MDKTSEIGLAKMAAFIDGEGNIGINKRKREGGDGFRVILQIGNTKYGLMDWLKNNFGGTVYCNKPSNKNWNACYQWVVTGIDAYHILSKVEKYLILKPEQAKIALKFWYETQRGENRGRGVKPIWKRKRQEGYYQEMKRLNKKGVVETEALNVPTKTLKYTG